MDAFVEQLTREQAIRFAQSGAWRDWSSEQIVKFQLFQNRLCMDFSAFHSALEDELGRPVWIHELGNQNYQRIVDEYLGKSPAPTIEGILDRLPPGKRFLSAAPESSFR